MAEIRPFRGEMYDPDRITSFEHVIAPPYDVISGQELKHLKWRSPHNIVHLLLASPYPTDTEGNNRYTRAAEQLKFWRWTGILRREEQPAFYLYEQQFTVHELTGTTCHTRRALIARVRLEPFDAGVIFPHEKTLAAPKEDRLQLLRACHTNLSSVLALYSDPEAVVEELFQKILEQPPIIDAHLPEEHVERLWRLSDPGMIEQIQSLFQPMPLVIADGHHRYETALFYRDEHLQRYPDCDACRYVLMALVRMESPGLVVLPIHRLLSGLSESALKEGWHQLAQFAEIELCASPMQMMDALHHTPMTAFGVYYPPHGYALLKLRENGDVVSHLEPTHSGIYSHLDVTRLHASILKSCFSLDTSVVAQQHHIHYTEETQEAIQRVDSGQAQLAFFLKPTRVDQVRDVAMAGETMPQKSTFFFPKLMTGLVLNPLD